MDKTRKQLAVTVMLGAMLGAGDDIGDSEPDPPNENASPFRQFHNAFRRRCRKKWRTKTPGRETRRHLGKKATRAAKRARIAQMKAAGHYRGHNSPYIEGQIYL